MEYSFGILIGLLIFNFFFFLIPSIFVYRLRNVDILRKRGVGVLLTQAATTYIVTSALFTYLNYFHPYQQQCVIFLSIVLVLGPVGMLAYFVRALNLIYENCRARIAISYSNSSSVQIRLKPMEKFSNFYFSYYRSQVKPMSTNNLAPIECDENKGHVKNKESDEGEGRLDDGRFSGEISNKVLLASLVPSVLLFIVILLIVIGVDSNEMLVLHSCPNYLVYTPIIAYLGLSFFIIPVMLHSIYWIKDGLGMRNEITLSFIVSTTLFVPFVVGFPIASVSPDIFGNGLYIFLICYNSHFTSILYPLFKVYQHNYRKSNLKKSEADFFMVLNNPDLYHELRGLMIRELCVENALFIEELRYAKDRFQTMVPVQLSALTALSEPTPAMKRSIRSLYRKFVAMGSPYQLNISYQLSGSVKNLIDGNENCGFEVFDTVLAEIHALIFENTYQRYILSDTKGSKLAKQPSVQVLRSAAE